MRMKSYIEKFSDAFFIATVSVFAIFLASDLFGVIGLSREVGGLVLLAVVSMLPASLVLFGMVSWFGGSKRHFYYLQVSVVLNLVMALIVCVVMNSGI